MKREVGVSAAMPRNGFDWRVFDAYLFDIDGTMMRSKDRTHRYAIHRAMRDVYGIETTIDGIAYHGKTDPGIIRAALERAGLPTAEIDPRMPAALDVCRLHADENIHLFTPTVLPGIPEILELLHRDGKLLGVASGNLESIGWIKVSSAGLRKYFQFGCFADHHELREQVFQNAADEVHRRLGPEASVCFLGDTPDDIYAAHKAKAKIISIGTGIYSADYLAALSPDTCVTDCSRLIAQ